MSYWVLTANGMVVSRMTVSRVINLEDQTYENKASITPLDKAIQKHFNDESHVMVQGGKGEPEDWSENSLEKDCGF